jgi:tetraacyldisaccharide 4'-kinase
VFRGDQVLPLKYLEDKSVFLFAGVGNFEALRRQVSALTGDIDFALELGDHQVYDAELLQEIKDLAEEHEADLLLSTFKDRVKLGDFDFGRELCLIDLTIDLDPGEEKFIRDLMEKLKLTPGKT